MHSFTKLKSSTPVFSGLAFLELLTALRMTTGQNTDGKIHGASLYSPTVKICFPVIGLWTGFIGLHLGTLDTPFLVHNLHTHPSSFHLLLQLLTPGLVVQYLNGYRE